MTASIMYGEVAVEGFGVCYYLTTVARSGCKRIYLHTDIAVLRWRRADVEWLSRYFRVPQRNVELLEVGAAGPAPCTDGETYNTALILEPQPRPDSSLVYRRVERATPFHIPPV